MIAFINKTTTILDITHSPIFNLKHMMDNFVPHRKHITFPPRTHQVNAVYMLVTWYINITISVLESIIVLSLI
jgi:hypothetical protein